MTMTATMGRQVGADRFPSLTVTTLATGAEEGGGAVSDVPGPTSTVGANVGVAGDTTSILVGGAVSAPLGAAGDGTGAWVDDSLAKR